MDKDERIVKRIVEEAVEVILMAEFNMSESTDEFLSELIGGSKTVQEAVLTELWAETGDREIDDYLTAISIPKDDRAWVSLLEQIASEAALRLTGERVVNPNLARLMREGKPEVKPEYDEALSEKIAGQLAEKFKGLAGCSHTNAFNALELLSSEALYVEGFVVALNLFGQHGWCEIDDRIVDPGPEGIGLAYFPIAKLTMLERERALIKKEEKTSDTELPIIWDLYGREGREHPNYMRARRAAITFLMDQDGA